MGAFSLPGVNPADAEKMATEMGFAGAQVENFVAQRCTVFSAVWSTNTSIQYTNVYKYSGFSMGQLSALVEILVLTEGMRKTSADLIRI